MDTNQRIDFAPITRTVADLVQGSDDGRLGAPTPCPAYTVGDLAEHLAGLTLAFTAAARKDDLGSGAAPSGPPPEGDASRLEPGWRERVVHDLDALADAWRDPSAYDGQTSAGGIEMSGAEAGVVALNELVVHGWDLARATDQPYVVDDDTVRTCLGFAEAFSAPGTEEMRGDAFGPVIVVPDDAPALDRLLGLMGREPGWQPPS